MPCDPSSTVPSLGCTTGCYDPVDTTRDFVNRAYVVFSEFNVRQLPAFNNQLYAWNFGMARLGGIDLDRPFESSQTHEYSRFVAGEWYVQNPNWEVFPGPTWRGPSALENALNAKVTYNSSFDRWGFAGAKIRLRFTARCIHSIYTDNPVLGGQLSSFTVYDPGQIAQFAPLATVPNGGPWQALWPCRLVTGSAPAHVITACAQNPFA